MKRLVITYTDLADHDMEVERRALVRYCTRFTGDRAAAEDLVQQTLLEAWHRERDLRDPQARRGWVFGIARNLCLMWARRRRREQARLVRPIHGDQCPAGMAPEDRFVDDFDLELALERDELARLLDRALALLPPAAREVLVQRYIEGSPQAEVATRLGVSEGAVEARLYRGKLLLRRVLTTDLRHEAAAYGLVGAVGGRWEETRIWCPGCGARRLIGRYTRDTPTGEFRLRCPTCDPEPDDNFARASLAAPAAVAALGAVKSYRPALWRWMSWVDAYLRRGLADGVGACVVCGRATMVRRYALEAPPRAGQDRRGVALCCPACGETFTQSLGGLVLFLPEGRHFWREHQRVRALPEREIEVGGRAAVVRGLESPRDGAQLDVVCARDTFEVLGIHPAPVPGLPSASIAPRG